MNIGDRVIDTRPGGWGEGTVIDSIGGVPEGEDHAGEWTLAVAFDKTGRHFVQARHLAQTSEQR